jgi:hypothetical protein
MATGHNSFPVVAELNSSAPCKPAAPVSPRERYPELPDLSDNHRPYSNNGDYGRPNDVKRYKGEIYINFISTIFASAISEQ